MNIPFFSIMQSVMDFAVPYLHVREAFGQKIGHFQVWTNHHVQHGRHLVKWRGVSGFLMGHIYFYSWCKARWLTCIPGWVPVGSMCIMSPKLAIKGISVPWWVDFISLFNNLTVVLFNFEPFTHRTKLNTQNNLSVFSLHVLPVTPRPS